MISISTKSKFTLEEVNVLIGLIHGITTTAQTKVKNLLTKLDNSGNANEKEKLEKEINQIIDVWQRKIEKLGGEPKGLWLADFDNGKGQYFCWKYPETTIQFTHSHNEGFSNRKLICNCTSLKPG